MFEKRANKIFKRDFYKFVGFKTCLNCKINDTVNFQGDF